MTTDEATMGGRDGRGWVGHVFDPSDDRTMPHFTRNMSGTERAFWAQAQTERYRVVDTCKHCGRDLIDGEQIPHRLKHASNGRVRAAVGTVLQQPSAADVREALAILEELVPERLKGGADAA